MFKAIILLTRREGMAHGEFVAWWLGEHAPLASSLPGLRRAVFNVVEPAAGGAEDGVDGVSELWFDSRADFEAAYATATGMATIADTLEHVSARVRLFVTEHPLEPRPAS
jgi:uncharacterized protein (TIGR02118 family)